MKLAQDSKDQQRQIEIFQSLAQLIWGGWFWSFVGFEKVSLFLVVLVLDDEDEHDEADYKCYGDDNNINGDY